MAVTSINIAQDNFTNNSNLIAVHNPVVFLINATFTGAAPTSIECIIDDSEGNELGRFNCIPYQDILPTVRQFMFIADSILRGYMDDFSDTHQSAGTMQYVDGMTKEFNLTFEKYMEASTNIDIVCIHASRQFGEDQNAEGIFENEPTTYYTFEGKPVYLYIYNDDELNTVSSVPGGSETNIMLDYDAEEFADYDGELFSAYFENP